jgi:hypothetical protein
MFVVILFGPSSIARFLPRCYDFDQSFLSWKGKVKTNMGGGLRDRIHDGTILSHMRDVLSGSRTDNDYP